MEFSIGGFVDQVKQEADRQLGQASQSVTQFLGMQVNQAFTKIIPKNIVNGEDRTVEGLVPSQVPVDASTSQAAQSFEMGGMKIGVVGIVAGLAALYFLMKRR